MGRLQINMQQIIVSHEINYQQHSIKTADCNIVTQVPEFVVAVVVVVVPVPVVVVVVDPEHTRTPPFAEQALEPDQSQQ